MANYLVTGGCGFIGSHLVDALHAGGHHVRILDDLSTGTLSYKPRSAEFIRGDVADAGLVATAMRGMDGCFHLAAVASVERSNLDWLGTHRTNLAGAVAVFDAARRVGRAPLPVVFASSAAVYGKNPSIPLSEEAAPWPLSAYAADKLACELHGRVASHVHGVRNCGLRFFNVYGPRQDPTSPYSGVISIFSSRLKAGLGITVFGNGQQTRDFIFVGDVVTALLKAMKNCPRGSEIFNVCTGLGTSVLDLAHTLAAILRTNAEIRFAPPRKGDVGTSVGDPTKAQRALGFSAKIELISGLRATLGQPYIRASAAPLHQSGRKARHHRGTSAATGFAAS